VATLKRGRIFYLVKRVPTDVAHLDTRKIVQISLKTDSGKEAAIKAVDVEEALMAYWDALRRNDGDPERYKALVKIAASRNLSYRPLRELYAAGGLEELLSRIQGLSDQDAANATLVDASLGGQARPALTLSMLPALYFDYEQDKVLGKSEDQKRRWRNPRIKAFKNLTHVLGDKDVHKLTRDDALRSRDWWQALLLAWLRLDARRDARRDVEIEDYEHAEDIENRVSADRADPDRLRPFEGAGYRD
jgi:hypothetical protein